MMKLIETRGLDGSIAYAIKKCSICGFEGWSDICENERLFGRCNPIKTQRRGLRVKYRKTPEGQVALGGQNLRVLFWGPGWPPKKKD